MTTLREAEPRRQCVPRQSLETRGRRRNYLQSAQCRQKNGGTLLTSRARLKYLPRNSALSPQKAQLKTTSPSSRFHVHALMSMTP